MKAVQVQVQVQAEPVGEGIILWLSRLFGVLLVPVALMAIFDLAGGLLTSGIPDTAAAWRGFFTMIAVIAGAVAGLTVRSRHSMRRKLIHLLLVAIAAILLARALFFPILPDAIPPYPPYPS